MERKDFLRLGGGLALAGLISKPGLQQNFNYQAVPGKFDGAVPYKKGDKLFV